MSSIQVTQQDVTSRDGTRIGYLRYGAGPGLVLVQGAMSDAYGYRELAEALSSSFTVYAVDRRGRGLSPRPYEPGHDIARDVEDLDAVLAATGARNLFGLSSGAVIVLEATRVLDRVRRAAAYEPPFYPDGISRDGIRRLNADIEQGDFGSALVGSILTSGTAPRPLRLLPRPIARLLGRFALGIDARTTGPRAKLRDLLPGVRYDFNVVGGMDGRIDTLAAIRKPVLLLSGTKSPDFLRAGVRTLERIVPDAQRTEITGLGHNGPWNAGLGGRPQRVATTLRAFFA